MPQAGTPPGEHGCATRLDANVPLSSTALLLSECFTSGSASHGFPLVPAAAPAAAGLLLGEGDTATHMRGARFVPCSGTAVHESCSPSGDSIANYGGHTATASPQARPQQTMSRVQPLPAMAPNAAAELVEGMPPLPSAPQQLRLGLHALLGQQSARSPARAGDRSQEFGNAPSSSGAFTLPKPCMNPNSRWSPGTKPSLMPSAHIWGWRWKLLPHTDLNFVCGKFDTNMGHVPFSAVVPERLVFCVCRRSNGRYCAGSLPVPHAGASAQG